MVSYVYDASPSRLHSMSLRLNRYSHSLTRPSTSLISYVGFSAIASSIARESISRRSSHVSACFEGLKGERFAGTKRISSARSCSRTCLASLTWPRWTGSKEPPKTASLHFLEKGSPSLGLTSLVRYSSAGSHFDGSSEPRSLRGRRSLKSSSAIYRRCRYSVQSAVCLG